MKAVRDGCVALFFAVLTLAPVSLQGADADRVQGALRDSIRSLTLQTDFPSSRPPAVTLEPRSLEHSGLDFLSDVAVIILWTAVFIIVVIIVVALYNNLHVSRRFTHRHPAKQAEDEVSTAVVARMNQAQNEADQLASRGSFAEAMHVLLLQSVTELRRRLDVSIAVSLTSREILHRIGLFPEGRAMLADIIHRVEISYFGVHQPDEEDYRACRRSFMQLTELLHRGNAA